MTLAKHIFFTIFLFTIIQNLSASFDIECDFKTGDYYKFGEPYLCYVKTISKNITTYESAQIDTVTGFHKGTNTTNDVTGFHSSHKAIHYFPRNLEKFFENLELIFIDFAGMKEIHQTDLKPFPKLIYLSLEYNSIEVLESGVFDANPNLEILSFLTNDLVHIEPKVFDNLPKLRCFWFGRTCVDEFVYNRNEALEAIEVARNKCVNADYVFMNERISKLETESKFLGSEEFTENFVKFEKSFEKSRFFNYSTLKNKFEGLRNYTVDLSTKASCKKPISFESLSFYDYEVQNSTIDVKIMHLTENMKNLVSEGLGLNNQLSKLNGKFVSFGALTSKKLNKIDVMIEKTRREVDAKLKQIENKLLKKIEDVLEEKLEKIFDEKLESVFKRIRN